MKKFYYISDGQQLGPHTSQELIQFGITKDTQIWCDGMTNWDAAGHHPELQNLFVAATPPPPPPPPQYAPPPPAPQQPKYAPPPQVQQQQYIPPQQTYNQVGQQVYGGQIPYGQQNPHDQLGIGLRIFSFIIPLVGIIIYFANKNTLPNKASSAGKAAGFGILVGIIINFIYISQL